MGKFNLRGVRVSAPALREGPFAVPTPGTRLTSWVFRDNYKRFRVAEAEPERRALKYITYNATLPLSTRLQAQMKLSTMPACTRMTQPRNRCIASGRGRAILSSFKMCRFQFKEHAKRGDLPGVKRASW
ncbi:mitochondrial 37S ribosomal uS14m domain-containing protein [Limtongia smithiae]|uniref:mitochondrial 37S ribosomal uS14m domain-containing protein n=1 Tax=Limtongia smithiae TaxID=1125753 RepID=UPI0034CE0C00